MKLPPQKPKAKTEEEQERDTYLVQMLALIFAFLGIYGIGFKLLFL